MIEHVSHSMRHSKISLLVFSVSSRPSNVWPSYDSPGTEDIKISCYFNILDTVIFQTACLFSDTAGRLLLSEWFSDNFMKLNEEKSHLLIFGAKNDGMTLNIGASQKSESEKLLGVTLDSKLNLNVHVN